MSNINLEANSHEEQVTKEAVTQQRGGFQLVPNEEFRAILLLHTPYVNLLRVMEEDRKYISELKLAVLEAMKPVSSLKARITQTKTRIMSRKVQALKMARQLRATVTHNRIQELRKQIY